MSPVLIATGQESSATLELELSSNKDTVQPGEQVQLDVVIRNTGDDVSPAPVFSFNALPEEWSIESWDGTDATYRDSKQEWIWISLEAGETKEYTITLDASEEAEDLAVTGEVSDGDENIASAETTIAVDRGSDSGGNSDGQIIVASKSITKTLYTGTADQTTIGFEQSITGTVDAESIGDFPSHAPSPDGQVIDAVDISVPDSTQDRSANIQITIPRSVLTDLDAEPDDVQIIRFDEQQSDELQPLNTVVVKVTDETIVLSADTPHFSVFGVVVPKQMTATSTTTPTATATPEPTATETTTTEPDTITAGQASETSVSESVTATPTSGDGPGFSILAATIGLLALVVLANQRQD
jgi:PGF-pre-PGF domain-containing protein/uncharacterized repeat protein (TIGR01451 family)